MPSGWPPHKRTNSVCLQVIKRFDEGRSLSIMAFRGDFGQTWVRTDGGWKPLADLFGAKILSNFRQSTPSSKNKRNSSSPSSGKTSPDLEEVKGKVSSNARRVSPSRTSSGSSSGSSDNGISSQERDVRLRLRYHLLSNRCLSIRSTSSRESNRYPTLSDAVQKLNFQHALEDTNCLLFICKVLVLVFETHYLSLSESLQNALLKITDTAKEIAIKNGIHCGLMLTMVEKAIVVIEKQRRTQYSVFGVRKIDSKIKSLLKMKCHLQEAQVRPGNSKLLHLPDDCLHLIISHLYHPRDTLNLGMTCMRLYIITGDNQVWKSLTSYHYGQVTQDQMQVSSSHVATPLPVYSKVFIQQYNERKHRLKEELFDTVQRCMICNFVFWKSYGHQCCERADCNVDRYTPNTATPTTPLTPSTFLKLFTS